ncbi:MAG: alanine racemase [Devosia sp.]
MTFPSLAGATGLPWRQLIDTPAVIIDLDVVERNITRAQTMMTKAGTALRPHIKTHKLTSIAQAQIAAGARGITVQKLGEAEIMADAGITDILVSYNVVGQQKIDRLATLAARAQVSIVADSTMVLMGLAEMASRLRTALPVLVECDTGMQRCGVVTPEDAAALALTISHMPGLKFSGLMTYPLPGQRRQVAQWLEAADRCCRAAGLLPSIVSSGGTPDLHTSELDGVINEYRIGTYVYNDRSLIARGACQLEDCALTVWASVVSSNAPDRAIIDAGSKILTSDLLGLSGHGLVMGCQGVSVTSLSEEHGHLVLGPLAARLNVGEHLRIVPNHACVVSNMVDRVHFVRGEFLVRSEIVSARGRVT